MDNSLIIPPQIEADKRLLKFADYEDYINKFLTQLDEFYLQSMEVCQEIAQLGYRSAGETLTRRQFEKRLSAVLNFRLPGSDHLVLASQGMITGNALQRELALREKSNKVGILATIIFMRVSKPNGTTLSGYIDYADRLHRDTKWNSFFRGQATLNLKKTDLGYYNWRTGQVMTNDSLNYTVVYSPTGVTFRNRFDRQILNPAPNENQGPNSYRKRISSKDYGLVVIFDHLVRQRI